MKSRAIVTILAAAAFALGCGSSGMPPILGGEPDTRDTRDTRDARVDAAEVRGIVQRVETRDRRIVLEVDDPRDSDLRDGETAVLYYEADTPVEYRGGVYRPGDLEAGDRIAAEVDEIGGRLEVTRIQVLYDVTGSDTGERTARDDDRILDRDDDGDRDGAVLDDRDDRDDRDSIFEADLRGTVRQVDRTARTLRIEAARYGTSFDRRGGTDDRDLLTVRWDDRTIVRFEGRRYTPDSLEAGDLVEVDVRALPGGYVAEEILVIGEAGSLGR